MSLFDYTGNWSKPYEDNGYTVIKIDRKAGKDVILYPSDMSEGLRYPREFADIRVHKPVYGILAAPPCTYFVGLGAKWPRSDDEIREGLSTVDACYRLACTLKPKFFCLENPVGKLSKWIGDPVMRFQPCDYGDPYTKRTCLWGWFNTDLKKTPVDPTEGSKMHRLYGGKSERTKMMRSITPMGFANAFYEANK